MVMVGPPAKEPAGVPVNPRHVQAEAAARKALCHYGAGLPGKLLEGAVQEGLKLLPVLLEPWAFIVDGQLHKEVHGPGGKWLGHSAISSLQGFGVLVTR